MIIKKIAVGNNNEAFIEDRLNSSINIIFSDDNNKGKTIIIQSLVYCLGNQPVFPSSFEYKKYFYYVEFSHGESDYIICRMKDTFIILDNQEIMLFDNTSEFKRYWSKKIFELPKIVKNNEVKIVDPELLIQLFFVGQDKKDTSNILNSGYYNKEDFINMIYDFAGQYRHVLSIEEINSLKEKNKDLKIEMQTLESQHKILESKDLPLAYLSQNIDKNQLEMKLKEVDKTKDLISKFRNSRNSFINRKLKYEITLKELNSLNRNLSTAKLKCMDCNSSHIGYAIEENETFSFDITTTEIRDQISNSIKEKIDSYKEEISKLTLEINKAQEKMQDLLIDDNISLETIVMFKKSTINIKDVENKLLELREKYEKQNDLIKSHTGEIHNTLHNQKELMRSILDEINYSYKQIDPSGNLKFESLFSKRDQIYSGSEATEFHLLKMFSLSKVLKHNFPIIVDSFRAEDLSTDRENKFLKLFSELNNQIIFTTTLKTEEVNKYLNIKGINYIEYSQNRSSKLLNFESVSEFNKLLNKLSITY